MRSANAVKNIKYNLVFFLLSSGFIFLSRAMFVRELGSELTGLNALFTSVAGFLNLAELGIVNVITFSLYKPLSNNDRPYVIEILVLFKYMYWTVGTVILLTGIILSFHINGFAQFSFNRSYAQVCFLLYILNVVLSYPFSYRYAVAVADQNAFIITRTDGSVKVIKSLIQITSLMLFKSYILWLGLEILFSLIAYYLCNRAIVSQYNWVRGTRGSNLSDLIRKHRDILSNTRNMFFHQLGSFVMFQTDTLLLARFLSLDYVTKYSNYMLVLSLASSVVAQIFNGLGASVGNLVSEGDRDRAFSLWKSLQTTNYYIAVVFLVCLYLQINNFIELWVGTKYVLSNTTVVLFLINLYFMVIRGSIGKFKDAFGIFWDKYIPLIESVINFGVSLALVKHEGINGVLEGTLVSNLFVMLFWTPFIVFKDGFKRPPLIYHKKNLKLTLRAVVPIFLTFYLNHHLKTLLRANTVGHFLTLSSLDLISISMLMALFLFKEESAGDILRRLAIIKESVL